MTDSPIDPLPAGDPLDTYFPVPAALAEHAHHADGSPVDADHLEGLAALMRELDGWGYGGTVAAAGHHEVSFHDAQRIMRYVQAAEKAWREERTFRDSFLAATMGESAGLRADLTRLTEEQGVTRSENARLRTSAAQMEEQATAAQARCDAAQDRAQEYADRVGALKAQLRGLAQARPAHTEIIRPASSERLTVLSEGSIAKIAAEVATCLSSQPVKVELTQSSRDRVARAVADRVTGFRLDPTVVADRVAARLIERAGPIIGSSALASMKVIQGGAAAAAQTLEALRPPEAD